MLRFILILIACVTLEWAATPAAALAQLDLSECKGYSVGAPVTGARVSGHTVLTGTVEAPVQIDCGDMQFFADTVELFQETTRIVAVGHVLFVSSDNRISAERMEFNYKTKTGTFFTASGTVTLGGQAREKSPFGTQEPDVYFYGETIEKLGPDKYKVSRGAFTTCVQPTPRWELVASSVTLNLDDYALLTNAVFRIKGVPILYLPVFYYPIQEDDRATGFLIPTYGNATAKGQSISNAFFWAIGRSHDATFTYDWFSKAGSGMGGDYRYVLGPGSAGNARVYRLNEREVTPEEASSTNPARAGQQSYNVRGNLTQRLPGKLFARANADYFSSITTQQRYQQDVFQATNRSRNFGGQVTGAWDSYSLSATAERRDIFYPDDTIVTSGSLPRISLNRGEGPIGGLPIYFGVTSEFVGIERSTKTGEQAISDQGLNRLDVMPTVRVPFTRWPFLQLNSSVSWRGTRWSESLAPVPGSTTLAQVAEPIGRSYFDFQTRITGPVFNRIFNTPGSGYAEKFKHVIEPSFTIQRVTAIDNFAQIVQLEGPDYVVGSVTRFNYALASRLYAKQESTREILTATVSQSYYTDANAVQYDRQFQSSFSGPAPTKFTPVKLQLRGSPSDRLQLDFSTEWDPTAHALRTLEAHGTWNLDWLQGAAGWSQRRFIPTLPGFDDPTRADHYLNASATIRRPDNTVGGHYSFNYDLLRDTFLQQRVTAYYNAQCCGLVVEYQSFRNPSLASIGIAEDRRFNISFSLAGIGTFSNFFGALGGQQNR